MWKEYFYYTRQEKRGILLVSCIIVAVTVIMMWPATPADGMTSDDNSFQSDYHDFAQSLKKVERSPTVRKSYYKKKDSIIPILQPFDPNTADSAELVNLGLKPWMASNVLSYRKQGGKFRTPESFSKIYGLSEELYNALLPYITLAEVKKDTFSLLSIASRDTLTRPFKYPAGTLIDLNSSDTTELKKIPGIGSGIAHRIVSYRNRVGGFYALEQLDEIHLQSDSLRQWFFIEPESTTRININVASAERLKSHPYINFYQAKAITEHRRKRGKLKNIAELAMYEEFTEKDLARLNFYVKFTE